MKVKFIEANSNNANWGKFMVCQYEPQERGYISPIAEDNLLRNCAATREEGVWVMDLATGEGAFFNPSRGNAKYHLNEKHKILVCILYEAFLIWLYEQDLTDIDLLPAVIDVNVPFAFFVNRRLGKDIEGNIENYLHIIVKRCNSTNMYLRINNGIVAIEDFNKKSSLFSCLVQNNDYGAALKELVSNMDIHNI
jgi:hypothetical protein